MARIKRKARRLSLFLASLMGAFLTFFGLSQTARSDERMAVTPGLSQGDLLNLKLDLLINALARERVFTNDEIQALREIGICSTNSPSQEAQACTWSPMTAQFLNNMPQQAAKIMPQQAAKIMPQQAMKITPQQ